MKTLLKLTAIATLAVASNMASAVDIGGVIFDPDFATGGPLPNSDFDADTAFFQWFVPQADAGTIDPNNVIAPSPFLPNGTTLQGVGEFTSMNGLGTNPSSVAGGDPGSFCPGCELTYVFNGIEVFNGGLVGGTVQIYVDHSPDFNPSNPSSVADVTDGVLWLSLVVDSIGFATTAANGFLAGFVDVLLSVVTTGDPLVDGIAAGAFDTNGEPNAADLIYSANANFLNNSTLSPFANGTADLKGDSIPVPGTLLLIGLGMLGFGVARRKRAQA